VVEILVQISTIPDVRVVIFFMSQEYQLMEKD
jgi:hypothetical protein